MKILVFAEQREGRFKKSACEVVGAGRKIAEESKGELLAFSIGHGIQAEAKTLGGYGASRILVADDPKLANYSPTAYAKLIADAARKEQADVVFLSATAMGKELAPRVAVRLEAGLAADCTALKISGGEIIATRPVYAGKALVDVKVTSAVKVFTLRPNVFTAGASNGEAGAVDLFPVSLSDADYSARVKETTQSKGKLDVAEADIIVSGGRGLKGPENFTMIEELAGALGAAVGASRAVVDAGWRPHDEQVGQTGKTVSPSLYIAVAISGAVQHLAGMSSSKYIVAINKDKDAPIFQVADYGIAGDAFEIVPALTREVKKLLGK